MLKIFPLLFVFHKELEIILFEKMRNGILLQKLFCPTVRKTFEILGFSFFSEF